MLSKPRPAACPECGRKLKTAAAVQQHIDATHRNPDWIPTKGRVKVAPHCPICGKLAELSNGTFGVKAQCCGLWSWGLKPLVSRETHQARISAHQALDAVWHRRELSRGECYRRLQILMGMSSGDCHIAQMNANQAQEVRRLVLSGALLDDSRFPFVQAKDARETAW